MMQNNIYLHEIILPNATENWCIILYDLVWYIATSGPFCKDGSHICYGRQCRFKGPNILN